MVRCGRTHRKLYVLFRLSQKLLERFSTEHPGTRDAHLHELALARACRSRIYLTFVRSPCAKMGQTELRIYCFRGRPCEHTIDPASEAHRRGGRIDAEDARREVCVDRATIK